MTRRNPMNERYMNEQVQKNMGKTRKSAASVKPKKAAAAGVTTQAAGKGKDGKKVKEPRKSFKQKREEREEAFRDMGPRAREKYLEDEYVRWNTWRKRCTLIAFVCLGIAMIYHYSLPDTMRNVPLDVCLWILPFIAMGVGIWISFRRTRPLGYLLGIDFSREGRKQNRYDRKERQQRLAEAYSADEERVKTRVAEKQDKVNERESRRLRNRASEKK